MKSKHNKPDETARIAFTIDEFCAAHRISRTHLYDLWHEGAGPRYMLAGSKKLITVEAAAEWRAEGEAVSQKSVA
jgi:hypothetical protein